MSAERPRSEQELRQEAIEALRESRENQIETLGAWIDGRPEGPAEGEAAARHRIETYLIPLAQLYQEAGLLDEAWDAWYEALDAAKQAQLSEVVADIEEYMRNPELRVITNPKEVA